jgi:hypothetical protein
MSELKEIRAALAEQEPMPAFMAELVSGDVAYCSAQEPAQNDTVKVHVTMITDHGTVDGGTHDVRLTEPAQAVEPEPMPLTYLRGISTQCVAPDGGIEFDWRFEECRKDDINEDGLPAFPVYTHPAPAKPLSDEQERALCEAYCNEASEEYFKARPTINFPEMRKIFYAGHRRAWINYKAAHGIKETS